MRIYGLIGKVLSYSFSKQYFEAKYQKENITNCSYDLFELTSISEFSELIKKIGEDFGGLNVTIPYKKEVIPYLDEVDPVAQKIGAVNVIKKENEKLVGYNSDYFGFKKSLVEWLETQDLKALILGTGGASDSVSAVLTDLGIKYKYVSRSSNDNRMTYLDLNENIIIDHKLIINTTPLGTFPNVEEKPDIPYPWLTKDHYLFDLVYNPSESAFLSAGKSQGAKIKNGLEMLENQAEEAWRIWN